MAKINNGALISYGPTLPTYGISDGTMFYKTNDTGVPQGLYLYGTISDTNSLALGNQIGQNWFIVDTPSIYVNVSGDTMTGPLTVPSPLSIAQSTGSQRLLIGNTGGAGANLPPIIEGQNGAIRIGTGNTWSGSGGTLPNYFSVETGLGVSGLKYTIGANSYQVWHGGNDGALSGLDADLLDGQHGSYYLNLSNSALTGTLGITKGGTGSSSAAVPGAIVYGASNTAMGYSSIGGVPFGSGTSQTWNILTSNGAAAPSWTPSTSLNVAYAVQAGTANTAVIANTAVTANTATNVPWTGITGSTTSVITTANTPSSGFTTYSRASLFYNFGNTGVASPIPTAFNTCSVSGFDSYSTSDIGQYQLGVTIRGINTNAVQLIAGWNFEELAPTGLQWRVNDDTGVTGSWGAKRTLWDTGNLTNLNQLINGPGYLTSASLSNYVLKSGDVMTGSLSVGNASGHTLQVNGITLNWSNSLIQTTGAISAVGNLISTSGNIIGSSTGVISAGYSNGTNGFIRMQASANGNSGYLEFFGGSNAVRTGYIGNTGTVSTLDAGIISYVASSHAFTGAITSTGNVTAYASDRRLKENIQPIKNAIEKVKSIGGYSYDWNSEKCNVAGFIPEHTHEHGLIAQEVLEVLPDAVVPAPFNNDYLTIRYERVIALLTAALNEQQKQIEQLTARIQTLEAK
jgi:hypothetical protein